MGEGGEGNGGANAVSGLNAILVYFCVDFVFVVLLSILLNIWCTFGVYMSKMWLCI